MAENNNLKKKGRFWLVISVFIICGFLAGLIGQTVSSLYFLSAPPANQGLEDFASKKNRASFLGQFFNYQLTESLNQSTVGIFLKKSAGSDALSQAYLPSELKGQGIILTSDGWILTVQESVKNLKANQLAIIFDQKSYEVDKLIVDAVSGGVFIHAVKTDNRNWPAAKIDNQPAYWLAGQSGLVVSQSGEVITANLKNLTYQPITVANNLIQSSDSFSTNLLMKEQLTSDYLGAPLINLGGEVIGLVSGVGVKDGTMVMPAWRAVTMIDYLLKENKVRRPFLGVNYLDLSRLAGVKQIANLSGEQLRRGALVHSFAAKSPAAAAGLIKGDVIIKVEDEQINNLQNLTDLAQEYKVGSKIKLLILRDGVDKEIEVTLGEQ